MRRTWSWRPTAVLGAAVALAMSLAVPGGVSASASDGQSGGPLLQAGWGDGDISPLGLIVGVIVAILALKLLFRLVAGPRWYGGPWSWDHRHAGWHGRFPHDAPDAFRRWHDQAHEQAGHDERREAVPTERPAPSPAPPSQPEPSQPPYGQYPGQPTYGQPSGSMPPWSYPAPPLYPAPPGQAPQAPYPTQQPPGPYPGGPPADPRR
jgi:hypothetical protein